MMRINLDICHSREGGNLEQHTPSPYVWPKIPACAGMTAVCAMIQELLG